ncbi:quinol monooxygenase YgiN [Nocardioides sp. HB32]
MELRTIVKCVGYDRRVQVVSRFRVPAAEGETFRSDLATAREALAACTGYAGGEIGRNVDDPELWVLTTRWENVGSYRRALSSYDVKLRAVAVLSRAIEEPSAYEDAGPGTTLNTGSPRSIG